MTASITYWRDLERWVPGGGATWQASYPLIPIGDITRPRRKLVSPNQFGDYQPLTIHFDGSMEVRQRNRPFKGSMFAALPGDLVYSKIDVRNGAIGLLSPDITQAVVTSEYPVLIPDSKQVDVRYLALLLRTPNFQRLLKQTASGTSGRKRVHPDGFAEIEVPLPDDTAEQQRLVYDYEAALAQAKALDDESAALERRAISEFEAALGLRPPPDLPKRQLQITSYRKMDRWTHEALLYEELRGSNSDESSFDFVQLDDVANVTYGLQKCPSNRPGKNARPYLRVANVQRGALDLTVIKYIDVPERELHKYLLRQGDLLLCEGNSADLVGRGAIWNDELQNCVHQNHVLKVRIRDRQKVLPEFILEYINSPQGQAYFRSKAKRTTNLASINSKEVAAMPLPLPDTLKEQETILSTVQQIRTHAGMKREQAAALRKKAWHTFIDSVFN